ncbi:MAG: transcription termination factor Rho, partial [Acidimicrobiaceae bacterium]|nr:transcription termination factor Rho [Acidimicrobiaceae bacterium]
MSTDQPQLERSVLEGKERDELVAISEALGNKPASRASKATLVDSILRAAGVDVDAENGAKPRRTRAKKAAGASAEAPAQAAEAPAESTDSTHSPTFRSSPSVDQSSERTSESGADAPTEESVAPPTAVGADAANGASADSSAVAEGQAAVAEATAELSSPPQQQSQPSRQQNQQGGGQNRQQGGGQNRQYESGGNDPGNRRNRRRRGRDRDRGPSSGGGGGGGDRGERDLPGMGQEQQYQGEPVPVTGYLDLRDEGYGFLRTGGYLAGPKDVYVSISQVRRFALRKGDYVEGASRPASSNEKYPALLRIDTVSGQTPDEARARPRFEDLTPLFPDEKLRLEVPGDPANMTARIVDLISPIGKGQRGLIVSPPKAGKTTVLKQIAHSIEANNPEV